MIRQLRLAQVKRVLEKGNVDSGLLKEMDALMGIVVLLAPLTVGLPPGTINVIVEVLGKRDALVKAGQVLLDKLKGVGAGDEVARLERLESAHVLITYTAFFDTVTEIVPDIWERLSIAAKSQPDFVQSLTPHSVATNIAAKSSASPGPETDPVTAIPHPLETLEERATRQRDFYTGLANGLISLLRALKIFVPETTGVLAIIETRIGDLIAFTILRYRAQYLELAKTFPEFHIWTGLKHQEALDGEVRSIALLAQSTRDAIDIGFEALGKAVAEIGHHKASDTMVALRDRYAFNLKRPIFDRELDGLIFPTRLEIFVPQEYRALRARTGARLESEDSWRNAPTQADLGTFLVSCLKSPYTENKPILIVGQPGSGKSLLTNILTVQLASEFDVIRVELRNVEADAEIHSQIVDFVERETQGAIVSWPELRKVFTRDAVVILDGFDELLQATGRTHAGYLKKVAEFQANELAFGRRVRVIVTSRLALIDRAQIPDDVVVMRLDPFDSARQHKWIEIWNQKNEAFFADPARNARPFQLPRSWDIGTLAQQPLLLMMLALYDSRENKLNRAERLNRTGLYNDLIRDFIRRERGKDPKFADLPTEACAEQVDTEMQRLGVAALGMFNRDAFSLRASELEQDLHAFGLEKPSRQDDTGELGGSGLFGRFFFVVKSETASKTFAQTAYEFLHATFGEFLAADFLATQIIGECSALASVSPAKREDNLTNPEYLPRGWFEGLMNAPLVRRPVVLQMLAEWLPQKGGRQIAGLGEMFDLLVRSHLAMILDGTVLPSRVTRLPVIGHAAIYTLNLVVLRALLDPNGFSIADSSLSRQSGATRGWDRLTHLWRAWFSFDVLTALPDLIATQRQGGTVHVGKGNRYPGESKLDRLEAVACALADNTLAGLSGYFKRQVNLEDVERYLQAEDIDISSHLRFRSLDVPITSKNRAAYVDFVADWNGLATGDLWRKAVQIIAADAYGGVQWRELETIKEMRSSVLPLIRTALTIADIGVFGGDFPRKVPQLELIEAAEQAIRSNDHAAAEPIFYELYDSGDARSTVLQLAQFLDKKEELTLLVRSPRFDTVSNIVEELAAASALGEDPAELHKQVPERLPELNAYHPAFAKLLRNYKGLPVFSTWEIVKILEHLAIVPSLSADVEVELLDFMTPLSGDLRDRILAIYSGRFPGERLNEISLASVPAARRAARFLNLEGVDEELAALFRKKGGYKFTTESQEI